MAKLLPNAVLLAVILTGAVVSMTGDSSQGIPPPPRATGPVSIRVDAAAENQVMDGFGATHLALVRDGRDLLSPTLRARALDALYRQVGLTTGNIDAMLLESPGTIDARRNDNDNPNVIDWAGFQGASVDDVNAYVLSRPEAKAFNDYYISQRITTRWASPWLAGLRNHDYQRYLDEAAEQVAAACIYWRDHHGGVTPLVQLFNEPLSGNYEVAGGETRDVVDLVQRSGERLTREGFDNVRFVVPNEETEEKSYQSAQAILENPRARRYVGAIGYHPYPLGSVYANVPKLLRTSGMGRPDPGRIQARRKLRDLARTYGLPLWMTEVSSGGVDARSYDDFRGRAIHIHDELEYANASAYYGMNSMWDMRSQQGHFGSTDRFFREEGNIVLLENDSETVHITGIGHAIGHYARWVGKGAIRVDANSSDPLLQVTAFRDDARGRVVLVFINNSSSARPVSVTVAGVRLEGPVTGEQSTPLAYWTHLQPDFPRDSATLSLELPGLSVTTLAEGFPLSSLTKRARRR